MASMDNSKKKSQILAADLRDEFNHQANILDEHSKNVNYARVGGGIVGAAGTGKLVASVRPIVIFTNFICEHLWILNAL